MKFSNSMLSMTCAMLLFMCWLEACNGFYSATSISATAAITGIATHTVKMLHHPIQHPTLSGLRLHAKKNKDKSNKSSNKGGKGFGVKKPVVSSSTEDDDDEDIATSTSTDTTSNMTNTPRDINDIDPDDINQIINKYKLSDNNASSNGNKKKSTKAGNNSKKRGSKATNEPPAFGEEILEKIPPALQSKIDMILITSTFASLFAVVACGVGKCLHIAIDIIASL